MAVVVAFVCACSNQGEGGRCDTQNGNDDCDTGLICKKYSELGLDPPSAAICCPETGATTVDACRGQTAFNPNGDGGSSGAGGAGTGTGGSTETGGSASKPDAGLADAGHRDGAP